MIESSDVPVGFKALDGISESKVTVNCLYVNELVAMLDFKAPEKRLAIYLDGDDARTTTSLLRAGAHPESLTPFSKNASPKDAVNALGVSFEQLMSTQMVDQIVHGVRFPGHSIFLDYCGSYHGNAGYTPKNDIRRLIEYFGRMRITNYLLAFVVSVHDRVQGQRPDCTWDVNERIIVDDVKTILSANGFSTNLYARRCGNRGNMLYIAVKLAFR